MRLAYVLCLSIIGLLPLPARAGDLIIQEPSLMVAPVGQSAAVLMRLENRGVTDDRLIGVIAGDLAQSVTLHTHVADPDGSKRMVAAADGIELPAGSVHVLSRGGDHARGRGGDHAIFLDLARIPVAGEEVSLILIFESGEMITLQMPVVVHPTGSVAQIG